MSPLCCFMYSVWSAFSPLFIIMTESALGYKKNNTLWLRYLEGGISAAFQKQNSINSKAKEWIKLFNYLLIMESANTAWLTTYSCLIVFKGRVHAISSLHNLTVLIMLCFIYLVKLSAALQCVLLTAKLQLLLLSGFPISLTSNYKLVTFFFLSVFIQVSIC